MSSDIYNNNSQKNQVNYKNCPLERYYLEMTNGRRNRCFKRTCPSFLCFHKWREREIAKLSISHFKEPWTHTFRCSPNKNFTKEEGKDALMDVLSKTKKWCDKHGYYFHYRLYSEQHGRSCVHWHGLMKIQNIEVEQKLRENIRNNPILTGRNRYSLKKLTDFQKFSQYITKNMKNGKKITFPHFLNRHSTIGRIP